MVYFWTIARGIQNTIRNFNYSKVLFEGRTCISCSRKVICRSYATSRNVKMEERKFSKKHTWVLAEGKIGTVGVSNYAQQQMDEFVYIELPRIDTQCIMNEPCGVLESLKTVIDLCSPVSGEVFEKNIVEDNPQMINESCYEKGWLFKLVLSKPNELKMLMNEAEYNDFVKKESEN